MFNLIKINNFPKQIFNFKLSIVNLCNNLAFHKVSTVQMNSKNNNRVWFNISSVRLFNIAEVLMSNKISQVSTRVRKANVLKVNSHGLFDTGAIEKDHRIANGGFASPDFKSTSVSVALFAERVLIDTNKFLIRQNFKDIIRDISDPLSKDKTIAKLEKTSKSINVSFSCIILYYFLGEAYIYI